MKGCGGGEGGPPALRAAPLVLLLRPLPPRLLPLPAGNNAGGSGAADEKMPLPELMLICDSIEPPPPRSSSAAAAAAAAASGSFSLKGVLLNKGAAGKRMAEAGLARAAALKGMGDRGRSRGGAPLAAAPERPPPPARVGGWKIKADGDITGDAGENGGDSVDRTESDDCAAAAPDANVGAGKADGSMGAGDFARFAPPPPLPLGGEAARCGRLPSDDAAGVRWEPPPPPCRCGAEESLGATAAPVSPPPPPSPPKVVRSHATCSNCSARKASTSTSDATASSGATSATSGSRRKTCRSRLRRRRLPSSNSTQMRFTWGTTDVTTARTHTSWSGMYTSTWRPTSEAATGAEATLLPSIKIVSMSI